MAKNLTIKQKRFVKEYVKSGNGTQSVLDNYDATYAVARSIASENLTKPNIQNAIQSACNQAGLSINRVGQHLKKWADSDSHDASLRAISLWGDFVGAKVHKIEGNIQVDHTIKDKEFLQAFAPHHVIDVDGNVT